VLLDPTEALAKALAARRSIHRQALALAGVALSCALWRLAPVREPEPVVTVVLVIGCLVAAVELGLARRARRLADELADALILSSFFGDRRRTPIERAVAGRVGRIERPRARHGLARDLRWRVDLARAPAPPRPPMARAGTPLSGAVPRAVLREEASLILAIADEIERRPVDPRALVRLRRVAAVPPTAPLEPAGDPVGEELRGQLRAAEAIIARDLVSHDGAPAPPG
jgi:hypothetical protein